MLIVNADDWGRSQAETDAAENCYGAGRITSVSAMVFMQDSERAAERALANGVDVGLHVNFTEPFTGSGYSDGIAASHDRIRSFLKRNKYAQLLYNPMLRDDFERCYRAQSDEFERLYGRRPARVDGHHHMHLCANMVWSRIIPRGTRIRRNFSFWPGEKGIINRAYRRLVDGRLSRDYQLADYFFDLTQCIENKKLDRVKTLAKSSTVELMTHPVMGSEFNYLSGQQFLLLLDSVNGPAKCSTLKGVSWRGRSHGCSDTAWSDRIEVK